MSSSASIRQMQEGDAAAVAHLTAQLGYEVSVDSIRELIRALTLSTDRGAFVACSGDQVIAWIELSIEHHLQSPPYALITGLVVSEDMRNQGIGKSLCAAAAAWSRQAGLAILRVRSRASRENAHQFYIGQGFQHSKTSMVFEKVIDKE